MCLREVELSRTHESHALLRGSVCSCSPIGTHNSSSPLTHLGCTQSFTHAGSTMAVYNASLFGVLASAAPSRNVTQICYGERHGAALFPGGAVLGWGDDEFGQATLPRDVLQAIGSSSGGEPALLLACGSNFTLALLANGSVIGWCAVVHFLLCCRSTRLRGDRVHCHRVLVTL
jgi:hypothetical protein